MNVSETFLSVGLAYLVIRLVITAAVFFLFALILMLTYNASITKMNTQYQKINYKTALVFTIFVLLISLCFRHIHS